MTDGASMPAIEGVTVGMTLDNCLAYCDNKTTFYKFFGESTHNNDDDVRSIAHMSSLPAV